jgi:hypothetical protein
MPEGARRDERRVFPARVSVATVAFYIFLMAILALTAVATASTITPLLYFLLAAFLFFLFRYVSTTYWMDADYVGAWRLIGTRRIRLDEVRDVEFANLRDLAPTGFFGSWGYRGRMWSPRAGSFDSIHTVSAGVMISAGAVPLFVSPKDPLEFARELSRRVRSYNDVKLTVDVPISGPSVVPAY